jgi:hypothetical protein
MLLRNRLLERDLGSWDFVVLDLSCSVVGTPVFLGFLLLSVK